MMNHEQRKNEIMRRSSRRIQLRRRVITACVPLVLCVAALSGWMLSGGVSKDSVLNDVAHENKSESALLPESGQTVQKSLLISAQVDSRTYTDRETLAFLEELLALPVNPEQETLPDDGFPVFVTDQTGNRFTLEVTERFLRGTDGKVRDLSGEQHTRLLDLLEVLP